MAADKVIVVARFSNREHFRVVESEGKEPLHILELPKCKTADRKETMRLLDKNGLRPLTMKEALSHASELIELKGKWFYLAGNGLEIDKWYHLGQKEVYAFNDKGELLELVGGTYHHSQPYPRIEETDDDRKVIGWSGDGPLAFSIYSDDFSRKRFGNDYDIQARFGIDAIGLPSYAAPVIASGLIHSTP